MSETPDRLPVERLLASAVRAIDVRWRRRWARLREYGLRGNPLLARDVGLGDDRSLWRSPLIWCFVAVLILPGLQLFSHVRQWRIMSEISSDESSEEFYASLRMLWPQWYLWVRHSCWWVALLAPAYFVARLWRRDRFVSRREQIHLAGITPSQLITARVLIWFFVPLFLSVSDQLTLRGWQLSATLFSEPGTYIHDTYARLAALDLWSLRPLFRIFETFAVGVLAILIAARVVLLGCNIVFALIIAAVLCHQLEDVFWYSQRALVEAGLLPRMFPYDRVFSLVNVAAAALAWWGLPRQVRRTYGPEGFERGR